MTPDLDALELGALEQSAVLAEMRECEVCVIPDAIRWLIGEAREAARLRVELVTSRRETTAQVDTVFSLVADIDRLRAANAELVAACCDIVTAVDTGEVRCPVVNGRFWRGLAAARVALDNRGSANG